jgi:hypothetical protein
MREKEEECERLEGQVNELVAEKGAWGRVEKGLKDKINKLQQDYF